MLELSLLSHARRYPEAAYVIVSPADRVEPVARSFRIEDGQIAEEDVVVWEALAEGQGG